MSHGRIIGPWQLPTGVFEMTPDRAASFRKVENSLLSTFSGWGYREIRTPAMEYLETMAQGLTQAELDIAFKLVDRYTGRMMVLRSDVTPQAARMAAIGLQDLPRPLRLCYIANVYRYPDDPGHPRRELVQAGAELLGLQEPQADAEVVALAVNSLRSMGLSGIRISIGQVRYARGLLSERNLPPQTEDRLMVAAHRKDWAGMSGILDSEGITGGDLRPALLALTETQGGDEAIARAEHLAPNRECRDALTNLRTVLELLPSYGIDRDLIQVDLGEVAGFRYHTGVVFAGFVSGAGRAVLRGGRYDHLAGRFGNPDPATGFAIDILELVEIASGRVEMVPSIDYMLVNRTGDRAKGLRIAVELRNRGRNILCLIRDLPQERLLPYAKAHSIKKALILEGDGSLHCLDPSSGEPSACDLEEL
ncbi:MAG: ATP phosphoribosyltransferase regulatory subunit [bacterium]|nr:MAG: ATP phosphoribosyltransferase regulatory subunit [bacterium]